MTKKQMIDLLYWVLFACVGFYVAYTKGWILADFKSVTPRQAFELLHHEKGITLLDVRTPEEYRQEHIEGATLMPVQALKENLTALKSMKEKRIIVYCKSGNRSVAASRILAENGFAPVNIKGGITQWKEDGLSVTK